MGLLDRFPLLKNILVGTEKQFDEFYNPILLGVTPRYSSEYAEQIATVYTCIKILAETISRLPAGVYQEDEKRGRLKDKDHYLYDLIHYNPNAWTSSNAFFNALEVWRNLRGNAYARIYRNGGSGKVSYLDLIPPDLVRGYKVINGELFYAVQKKGTEETEPISATDILHFRMITKDGILGINPIEALRLNLSTTWEALGTINEFYQNNAVNPKAIKSTVSGANQKSMLEALNVLKKDYQGAQGAGKIIPLPPNTEIQELQMNAIDAVFLQMVEFNANQIAALFGIPAHLVGNTTTSKYNNIEQTQLAFKSNTISSIARMYRQELEYKLLTTPERKTGKSIEFNLMALVETDHRDRLEGYRILSNIGAITPNKIAALEGLETYEGGDDHYIQTNMMSVEQYNAKSKKPQNPPQ